MSINLGSNSFGLYLGSTKISEAYIGNVKVLNGGLPLIAPKTLRFQFTDTAFIPSTGDIKDTVTDTKGDTSSVGTWKAVSSSSGIYDWNYNNTTWNYDSNIGYIFNLRPYNISTDMSSSARCSIIEGDLTGITETKSLFFTRGSNATVFNALTDVSDLKKCADLANTRSMFSYCQLLESIEMSNMSSLTNAGYMFRNCSSLTSLALSGNTLNIDDASYIFNGCSTLTSVPSIFNFNSASSFESAFYGCFLLNDVKKIFNALCLSPAGKNGNYFLAFQNAGRDSANNQLSRIPSGCGGTMTPTVTKKTGSSSGSTSVSLTVHPFTKIGITITRNSSNVERYAYTITNSTTPSSNRMTLSNYSDERYSTASAYGFGGSSVYAGFDYSHTNSLKLTPQGTNAGGTTSYSISYEITVNDYPFDLLE